ncbi:ABC transporter permease [Labrys wisconsinensis]|uniref:Ribose/xylose/arabinose/galactoside ABC-type transport system permease subunit n=1 Tax=Labrys wisconsinensis TaxID=425677 RepID=A0ABU0JH14_9HYPH|nr:ABC transporter permease [Labrys wisconsinensis]MDQ0473590.1 ribose/xylose/arabinose/galactoside ABC-type transport system permease subunit [Labrys wisconsinensis]
MSSKSEALLVRPAADASGAKGIVATVGKIILLNPILPILAVALPLFAAFVPFYATTTNLQNLLLASSILLLLSCGGALAMITGNIDLSVEGTLCFSSMFIAWLMMPAPVGAGVELSPLLCIPLGIAIGVGIGMLNGLLVQGLGVNPFIVTLGMLLTLKGAAAIPTQATTVYTLPSVYSWVGYNEVFGVSWIVIVSFTVCLMLACWLKASVIGRHIYAVGGNVEAARENGISPFRTVTIVYALSGGLAGLAGWLNAARLDSASANSGDGITFTVFAAIIIGGIALSGGAGSLWGVLGGVILLSSIDNVLNLVAVNPLYLNFVRGAVIIVAVLLIVIRQRLAARLGLQEAAA